MSANSLVSLAALAISADMHVVALPEIGVASPLSQKRSTHLFFAPWPICVAPKNGNKRGRHEHDMPWSNRTEANNPCMPDFGRFARTGNPYPTDAETILKAPVSNEKRYSNYRHNVALAACLFPRMLAIATDNKDFGAVDFYGNDELFAEASALIGVPVKRGSNPSTCFTYAGILDTLRDLENVGVIYCTNGANGFRSNRSRFRFNVEFFKVLNALSVAKEEESATVAPESAPEGASVTSDPQSEPEQASQEPEQAAEPPTDEKAPQLRKSRRK